MIDFILIFGLIVGAFFLGMYYKGQQQRKKK